MTSTRNYSFREIDACEMCGDPSDRHTIMGQRLSASQGLRPRKATGISVTVKRCTNCQLIYASPQPIPANIQDHYGTPPEDYWRPEYFKWTPDYFGKQIEVAKELLPYRPGMTALDIGAGLGKAMLSLEAGGFDTYGLEPSGPFYERAIAQMGISQDKLQLGTVEEAAYSGEQFDFITFGAVLEHLYEPAASIAKALEWLKPGGIIQIEVPSSRWLIARLIDAYYRMMGTTYTTHLSPMHSPFHLHEFGMNSFQYAGERLGYEIAEYHYDVCSIPYVPKLLRPPLRWYMHATETGMQLTVYLRKSAGPVSGQ